MNIQTIWFFYRQNSTFQPDPIFAWDTQSPTVGNQQPSRRDFPPQNTPRINDVVKPITPIPHVGKHVATPGALVPTPKPDYSPPMRRPVKHVWSSCTISREEFECTKTQNCMWIYFNHFKTLQHFLVKLIILLLYQIMRKQNVYQ